MHVALHIAEREFPIASDREAAQDALLLKEACQAALCYDWLIALCLLLEDSLLLAGKCPKQFFEASCPPQTQKEDFDFDDAFAHAEASVNLLA